MNTRLSIKEMNEKWNIKIEGLHDGSTFEFQERQNGYQNCVYQIIDENGIKTDDALIVETNKYNQHNGFYNNYTIDKNYYARRKTFAQETGSLAKNFNIDFATALTLEANEHKFTIYAEAREKIQALATFLSKEVLEDLKDNLSADITRKKQALKELLGEKTYSELGINKMGQINSVRLAQDCIKQLESPLSKDATVTPYFQQLLAKSEICAIVNGYYPQTEESKVLKLSVTPLDKSQGKYAIMMQMDNQATPVSVATFEVVFNSFVYRGNILFDDTITSTVGEALYGDKTFGELNSAIYSAFTTDNLSGFNLHLTASQLGIEQDVPLDENIVYDNNNLDEH